MMSRLTVYPMCSLMHSTPYMSRVFHVQEGFLEFIYLKVTMGLLLCFFTPEGKSETILQ